MSWNTSARPPLPPRPLSTYPSSDYDGQQQSMTGRSSRQSIGSPPTMNYDFQPMGYTSPAPPPPFNRSPYQQQQSQQQYTPYPLQQQQQPPAHPDYIWNGGSLSSSNRASVSYSPAPQSLPSPYPQQYQQSPIPGSYPQTNYQATQSALPRPYGIDSNPAFPVSASAPALPIPRRSLPSPIVFEQMASPPMSHIPRPSSSSIASSSSTTSASAPPSTAALPTVDGLTLTLSSLDSRSDIEQVLWAQDVIRVLERHLDPAGTTIGTPSLEVPTPAAHIPGKLAALVDRAAPIIISHTSHRNNHIASLASYLRGKLLASGSCEDYLPRDPRQAFKDFETAARGGEIRAWYRLGRDYETVGDIGRAKDCFERGQGKGDCEATYKSMLKIQRMGMAHLLGQLNLQPDPYAALSLLREAYKSSTIDCPQPAYVFGMLHAGEMEVATDIPHTLVLPQNTHETAALSAQLALAREALERAAYLCLPQAQYKCGWMYEHAAYGCAHDPLMSVQWYSLASQGGEIEADMALSKWFLCGAEGHFGKNEKLARTFAEKSARKGHQNGAFAMGYYYELGIGGRRDTEQATKWYEKAARLGNQEAIERMKALSQPNPHFLSTQEHEKHLNNTLVRTRTDAASRSGQRGDRQNRRRDQAERERMMIEADRAARQRDRAEYNPMSPIPEMMSPSPANYPSAPPQPMAFPARPSVPYQSFAAPVTINRRQSPAPGAQARRYSQVPVPAQGQGQGQSNGADRLPSPVKGLGMQQGQGGQGGPQKGPKTFAEMGFQSKPVEGEGCLIT